MADIDPLLTGKAGFKNWIYLAWQALGLPEPTPIQYDIADWVSNGPRRLVVQAFRGVGKTKGGLYLSDSTLERQQVATVCSYVLDVGSLAYKDEEKFPTGAWCKKGEWILHARYAGSRFHIEGGEVRILNDDEVLATIKDPDDILHLF